MTGILKVDTIQRNDGSTPTAADLGLSITGNVIQVHHFTYTPSTTFQTSSSSFTDVTGASTTFTPSQSGGYLIIQAVVPCELYGPSGNDVFSYTALFDSTTNLQQRGFQGDNLGKLGDIVWLPVVGVHHYKLTHSNTNTRTFKIRVANNTTSQQIRIRSEHSITITVMEIAG